MLGVAYRMSRRISPMAATAISTMPLSGFGNTGSLSSFAAADDPFSSNKPSAEAPPQNFQLYRFEECCVENLIHLAIWECIFPSVGC